MGLLDTRASRSKARADVAELYVTLAEEIQTEKKEDTHVINIAVKRALSVTEFKQMFYARGDDNFCIANGQLLLFRQAFSAGPTSPASHDFFKLNSS